MRKTFIAGNWKMHHVLGTAQQEVENLCKAVGNDESVDVAVCPPYVLMERVAKALVGSSIKLGAQNVFWEEKGAFTGEIAPLMLKDVGCYWVIVGHSERRQLFNETNENVFKKLKAVINAGLYPIMCCGETLEQREAGKMEAVIRGHLEGGLGGLTSDEMLKTVVAYEPVWAIGTGKTATPQQAQEVHLFIRGWLTEKFGTEVAEAIRLQYGGSVKPENISELIAEKDIDGALVGGASLSAATFAKIVENSKK